MKKVSLIFILLIGFGCISYAQTITIGTQVWMTKNLDVATFRNGDTIPQAKTDDEWSDFWLEAQPAWCYYDNDPANGAKYGKLYNWYAVNDPRGLAPVGYHIPSDAEWTRLADFLGGENVAGTKMRSKSGWDSYPGGSGNGTNTSGFSGLPGGNRDPGGRFDFIEQNGFWWSSTESNKKHAAWSRDLWYIKGSVDRYDVSKDYGFSVRCLRD